VYERYQVHDELWRAQAFPLPPPKKNKDTPGRPTTDDRKSTNAIFYVLRTGCQWKALPRSLGAPSTVHDGFEEWKKAELSRRQGRRVCSSTTRIKGIEWEWQSMATVTTKAPLGGKAPAPTPRKGRTGPTLKSIVIERAANERRPQNMRMDEGYDFPEVDGLVADYKLFIVSKGLRRNGTKPPASAFLDDLGSCLGVTTRTLHGCRVLDVVQADRNEGPDGLAKADPSRLSLALVRCISQQSGVKLVVHRDGESFHPYGLWSGRRY